MLFVTLSMYILYSAYWALDVYLLWIEIYRYLPREGAEPAVMFLDGLLIPWSVAYYAQTAIQFIMVNLCRHHFRRNSSSLVPAACSW